MLLTLGVVAAVASRAVALSPIVGYLVLGMALSGIGIDLVADSTMIAPASPSNQPPALGFAPTNAQATS